MVDGLQVFVADAVKLRYAVGISYDVQVCGCQDAVSVFLNPWGLSQLSIQLTAHTPPLPSKLTQKRLPCYRAVLPAGAEGNTWKQHETGKPSVHCLIQFRVQMDRPEAYTILFQVMRSLKELAKLAMLLLLAFLLLCDGVRNVHGKTIHENSVDLHVLLDFKKGITNDPPALSNWSTTAHFCHWNGVTCTKTPPFRVLYLILSGQNLEGQISSSLGNLTFLSYLDLSGNNFVGPLPILGHLQKLQYLYLYDNHLNGTIPDSLTNCFSLTYLDLSANSLVGVIPSDLDTISDLAFLNLSANSLVGAIPPKVGFL
ncbi:hypothetical protein ACQ4PT_043785 [Festuca glaucescens]